MKRTILALFVWATLGVGSVAAQDSAVPVIEAGREEEVLALFAPYRLTGEVVDGFRLMNVRIESTHVVVELVGPGDEMASVRLDHPEHADEEPDGQSESFAIRRASASPLGSAAADAIAEAVIDNDRGGFFRSRALSTPIAVGAARTSLGGWARDGLVVIVLGFVFFLVLLGRELGRGTRGALGAVLSLTIIGAYLRMTMSPVSIMGAWPFSRTSKLMHLLWDGPGLRALLDVFGADCLYFDAAFALSLLFAVATPAAVFLHAKKLLDDERVAVLTAAIVVFLPAHLRFSQSEVAFIPSIALSSFTFALLHVALKDESAWFRAFALLALPLVASVMFITRPLNQIFLPLLLWTALFLARRSAPPSRRLLAAALVTAAGVFTFVTETQVLYGGQIAEGASLQTVIAGVTTFLSPTHNTLLYPVITPLVVLALAIGGLWWSSRLPGPRREQTIFLSAWLLLFYVAHAYVLPRSIEMQARYHLHLLVPFAMLAALGLDGLFVRRRTLFWLAAVLVALSPLMHRSFVRDLDFNDMREFAFVREAAEQVSAGCTVLEYTGTDDGGSIDVRFDRAGALLDGNDARRLFAALSIGAPPQAPDPLRSEVRALLEEPPSCLYYYEGLFCYARKAVDAPIAPACAEMHHTAELDAVRTTRFMPRTYDGNLAEGIGVRSEPIVLTLFRVGASR